jgi:hypothetical protein
MAKVEPIDPMQPTGDGKSFLERMQRGMKNSDPETQKKFAETLERMVQEGKAANEARNEYKKVPAHSRAGGVGGDGGDLEKGMMGGRFKPLNKAKGGKVSSASKRADGCCVKGKTKGKML